MACSICQSISGWFSGGSNQLAGQNPSGWFLWIGFLLAVVFFWKFFLREIESLV